MKKSFFWRIYNYFAGCLIFIFALIITILVLILDVFLVFTPDLKDDMNWYFGHLIARFIFFLYGCKVNVEGIDELKDNELTKNNKYCLVANHTSMFDIMAIIATGKLRCGFIAKKSLLHIPILHYYMRHAHCVFVDRKNMRSNIEAIRKGVENINKGVPMFIFPEGTRSKTGKLGEFKRGSFKLATRSTNIVVPVAIKGYRDYLESRTRFSRKGLPEPYMKFLEPIDVSSFNKDEEKIVEMVKRLIENEIEGTN